MHYGSLVQIQSNLFFDKNIKTFQFMFPIYNDDLWLKISFRQVEFCETMAQGTTNLVLAAEENLFGFMPYDFIKHS